MAAADDLVHCPICLEVYEEPRALPCLHTFCNICMQEYINAAARKTPGLKGFGCPVCRRHTPSPGGSSNHSEWASLFPLNHIIISLLDSKERSGTDKQGKDTKSHKSDLNSTRLIPQQNVLPSTEKEMDYRFDDTKEREVTTERNIVESGSSSQTLPLETPQHNEWTPPPPPHGHPPPPHGHPPHHWPPPHHGHPPHHGPPFHHGPPRHGHPPPHGQPPPHWPPHAHHGPRHRGRGCHGRGRFHHPP